MDSRSDVKSRGAERLGFPSIVGSGPNSTTLHYDKNRRTIAAGDLVVMDVGGEYGYYTADVTRTVPVNGTFTPRQREIYELVLATQQVGIGQNGSPYVGFLPGYFMHSLGGNEWDVRKAYSNNYFDSDSYAPVNYMQVSQAQAIPDGGATGPLMVGSLAGMVAMARFIRRRKSIAASEV